MKSNLLTIRLLQAALLMLWVGSAQAVDRVTYFVPDALGSPVAAMNEQGNVLWRESYAPYGERRIKSPENPAKPAYTGKSEDPDTGLVYMGARMYDPEAGRFTGIDPQGFKESNVQSFGRYAYANNSPYVYVDPDGEAGLVSGLLIWMGIGGLVGAGSDAAFQYALTGHVDGAQVGGAALSGMPLGPLAVAMTPRAAAGVVAEELSGTAASRGPVIVGETMSRVEATAAKTSGAKILNDMPDFKAMGQNADQVTSSMMQYNRKWILEQMRSGRPIIDIGRDPNRAQPSIFYEMEQRMVKNYQKLHPEWSGVTKK